MPFDLLLTDLAHEPAQPWFYNWQIDGLSLSTPLRLPPDKPVSMWDYLRQPGYGVRVRFFALLLNVLQGEAIDEMRPDADLIRKLERNAHKERDSGIAHVALAGMSVTYTRLYLSKRSAQISKLKGIEHAGDHQ